MLPQKYTRFSFFKLYLNKAVRIYLKLEDRNIKDLQKLNVQLMMLILKYIKIWRAF